MQRNIQMIMISDDTQLNMIKEMAKEIWHHHYTPIIGKTQVEYMLKKFHSLNAMKTDILQGYIYYIVRCDDIPCGYFVIKQNDGIYLSKFYLMETYRNKGVGKKMMEAIIAFAREKNEQSIWLHCNRNNTKSLEVYNKLGFHIVETVDNDIGNGFFMNDYILRKKL